MPEPSGPIGRGFFTVVDNPDRSALELRIGCDDIKCYMEIHNQVRRMFDLDTRIEEISRTFSKSRVLSAGMSAGQVPRLPVAFHPFEAVVPGHPGAADIRQGGHDFGRQSD